MIDALRTASSFEDHIPPTKPNDSVDNLVLFAVFFLTQATGSPTAEVFIGRDCFLLVFHHSPLARKGEGNKMDEMSASIWSSMGPPYPFTVCPNLTSGLEENPPALFKVQKTQHRI